MRYCKFKSEPPLRFLPETEFLNLPGRFTTVLHRVIHGVTQRESIGYDCICEYLSGFIAFSVACSVLLSAAPFNRVDKGYQIREHHTRMNLHVFYIQ